MKTAKFGYIWGTSLVRFISIIFCLLLLSSVIYALSSWNVGEDLGCLTDSECEGVVVSSLHSEFLIKVRG